MPIKTSPNIGKKDHQKKKTLSARDGNKETRKKTLKNPYI
jgi:hypothetical protein